MDLSFFGVLGIFLLRRVTFWELWRLIMSRVGILMCADNFGYKNYRHKKKYRKNDTMFCKVAKKYIYLHQQTGKSPSSSPSGRWI